ncbi:MAG: hypothetical protein HYV07_10030 [Deltaproteobacteria bacterium]|nr:hypothetical protein [Deltaproteobacteria bacterium]
MTTLFTAHDQLEVDLRDGADPSSVRERIEDLLSGPAPSLSDPPQGAAATVSLLELRALSACLAGVPRPDDLPAGYDRGAYRVVGTDKEAQVWPAFAIELSRRPPPELRTMFPDLWAIDLEVWNALATGSRPEVARLWLTSPGRRLALDLEALHQEHRRSAVVDFSSDRLLRACGLRDFPAARAEQPTQEWLDAVHQWLERQPEAWRELHLTTPGPLLRLWRPATREGNVARALEILERRDAPQLQSAALAWLLDVASNDPIYSLGTLRRDLRPDLPARLVEAMGDASGALGSSAENKASRQLSALILRHASCLMGADAAPGAALRCWGVAHWLGACLRLSPVHGGDRLGLAAQLGALRHDRPPTPPTLQPLHPRMFRLPDEEADAGLEPEDVSWAAAAAVHYLNGEHPKLRPMPVPLVERLLALASRPMTRFEVDLEQLPLGNADDLRWFSLSPNVAPPLVARRVLTEEHVEWMLKAGSAICLESLRLLERKPQAFSWLTVSFQREGRKLDADVQASALRVFRNIRVHGSFTDHDLVMFSVPFLTQLSEDERVDILARAASSEADWQPWLLGLINETAQREHLDSLWTKSLETMFGVVESPTTRPESRLNLALVIARRLSPVEAEVRRPWLNWLQKVLTLDPLPRHLGLRRELQRLGLRTELPKKVG